MSFKKVNGTNYEVEHNGQSVWNGKLRQIIKGGETIALDPKAPITWADRIVGMHSIPLFFRKSEMGRSEMIDFIMGKRSLVIVANGKKTATGKREYIEPNRIAQVEYVPVDGAIHTETRKRKNGENETYFVLWTRLVRYL